MQPWAPRVSILPAKGTLPLIYAGCVSVCGTWCSYAIMRFEILTVMSWDLVVIYIYFTLRGLEREIHVHNSRTPLPRHNHQCAMLPSRCRGHALGIETRHARLVEFMCSSRNSEICHGSGARQPMGSTLPTDRRAQPPRYMVVLS